MLRRSFFSALVLVAGCGGNVVVDHGSGTGGAGGTTSTSTVTPVGPSTTTGTIGVTVTASSTGTGTSCPDRVYEDGICQSEGQVCPMALSCCDSSAVCKGGQWHYLGATCGQPCSLPCGPDDLFACQAGALCVIEQVDVGTSYHCAANPCPGSESCACVSSVCDGLTCEQATSASVICDCPNC